MQAAAEVVLVQLNVQLLPAQREALFEGPLAAALARRGCGEIQGGGTMQGDTGEIKYCDIELTVHAATDDTIQFLIETLEALGAPKKSMLTVPSRHIEQGFGKTEGLAVYLDGANLPAETYQACDPNVVYEEFERLLGMNGRIFSFWQSPMETAFYIFGDSFAGMKAQLDPFLDSYPLCANCRVVRLA
jgi:hypothetical protein